MKVLVVEDDPNLRTLWRKVLVAGGHAVDEAGTLLDARRSLISAPFDIVVLDLSLGRDAGPSLTALATYANPDCKVVVVTGASSFRQRRFCDKGPAVASVLRKPVDVEHFAAVCAHLCVAMSNGQGRDANGVSASVPKVAELQHRPV